MPQPLSVTVNSAMPSRAASSTRTMPVLVDAVQGVGQQVEHHLLDLLRR